MKKAIAAFAAGKDRIEIKALSDDIATLDKIRDMLLEGYRKASENFKARTEGQKNTAGEAVDSNYSIKVIVDDNGKEYNNAVVLDTNIFDGVKPRNWSKILTKHLVNNFAGKQFTVYDENGLEKTIEFARKKDRVKKDGANRSHIVLDKLSRKSDINSQLVVAHADEIIQVMKLENEAEEHSHQWLDENGWSYYKAILMQKNNKIFEAKINVAKARDGRNILYDINKIKEIGHGVVSSKSPKAQRDSHINPDFYEPILSQKDTSVNTNSLKNSSQSQELKNWFGDWRKMI
ncbi:MAG: hypothetical protein PUH33_06140 [Clostridiaceae bacterium]|nr:hypothetical protein [Clostridiaceae bacterium]